MLTPFQETKLTYLFDLLDKNNDGVLQLDDFMDISDAIAESLQLKKDGARLKTIRIRSEIFFTKLIANIEVGDKQTIKLEEWLHFFDTEIINGEDELLTDELIELILNYFFGSFDQNRDGYTSIREYILMFTGLGIPSNELTAAFMRFDMNGDCKLSRYELKSCIESFLISDHQREPGNWIFGPVDF